MSPHWEDKIESARWEAGKPVRAIRSLADLRPGDIMFGPIGGIVPGLFPVGAGQALLGEVFRSGVMSSRHVGVVVEAAERRGESPAEAASMIVPDLQWVTTRDDRLIMKGPRLVQAMPHGAEEIELTEAAHWTDRHAYVRIPEDYPGQGSDAAAIARLFVSERVPYSFLSYAALIAWKWGWKAERLERWIDRRRPTVAPFPRPPFALAGKTVGAQLPCEAICSVLADQAWSLAGKRVMEGVPHQAVTPGAMAARLFAMQGIEWGGKGFL